MRALASGILALLTACGGGGGGGSGPPPADVIVSGTITFDFVAHDSTTDGLDYAGATQQPARGVTVQAIRSSNGAVLDAAVTDSAGHYSLDVPENTTMFVRVRAEMKQTGAAPTWDFSVVDNTSGDALYTLSGSAFDSGAGATRNLNAASGFGASGTPTGARAAGPFAILDSIYQAFNKVLVADPATVFLKLVVGWSPDNIPFGGGDITGSPCADDGNIGTSFYEDGHICLLGLDDVDTDEHDDHVIVHEWGHYFEDTLSRSDNIGGAHGNGDVLDMRVAFGEGFGNAWSGIVTDDSVYRDSNGDNQSSGFSFDVDDNSHVNPGWYSEGSVHSILYDLYDSAGDGADGVALGVAPLLSVLRNPQRTGVPLTSIFSFISALKVANPGSAAGIVALVNGQGIVGDTIDAYGSTETDDAGDADTLPVYTDITLNGVAKVVCSIETFGDGNRLGVSRFLKFTLGSAKTVTFHASGGTDPDLYLHQAGFVDAGVSPAVGSESFSHALTAGDYVLEALDYVNADGVEGNGGRSCLSITISD